MKIDLCEKTYTTKELCTDIQYCCTLMKSMVKQHYIDIDTFGDKTTCELMLDDDRNYTSIFLYNTDKDIIQLNYKVNINYCPFCGENINIGERVIGSPI